MNKSTNGHEVAKGFPQKGIKNVEKTRTDGFSLCS